MKKIIIAAAVAALGSTAAQAGTLEDVTKKGYLSCGVVTGVV